MKVLIIQENGRHSENEQFRECFSMQRSLTKLGCETTVWGLGHKNFEDPEVLNKEYDIILNLENYDTNGWSPNICDKSSVKLLWSIDAHCRGMKPYMDTYSQGKYDKILQSTKYFLNEESIWFPNCFDDGLITKRSIEKTKDIGFCGSLLNRAQILTFLNDYCGLEPDIWVLGDAMVNTVNSYWIHFNINLANDINYRSFETLVCGTVLLTNYNPQYLDLGFKDEVNCLLYKSQQELTEKIDKYLKKYETLDKIAQEGLELSKQHTYDKRAELLLSIYKDIKG